MQELTNWIDEPIDRISNTDLFALYFKDCVSIEDVQCFYLTNLNKGIELVLSESKVIRTIHLYGSPESLFEEEIPLGLSFSLSRTQVINRFGKPLRSGERHRNLYLGMVQSWDKYLLADFSIRFEYNNEESDILLITIASLGLEKYLNAGLQ
jgi:hypothetical protein